jgi:hypothetical protein
VAPPTGAGRKVVKVLSNGTSGFGGGSQSGQVSRSTIPGSIRSRYVSPNFRPPTGSMVSEVTLLVAVMFSSATTSPASFTPTPASFSVGTGLPCPSSNRTLPGTFRTAPRT